MGTYRVRYLVEEIREGESKEDVYDSIHHDFQESYVSIKLINKEE
jgi:hypothetical protein